MNPYDDFFGGQRVRILVGEHKGKEAFVSEPSQEIYGLQIFLESDNRPGCVPPYLHFRCEELERMELRPAMPKMTKEEREQYEALESKWEQDKSAGMLDD